MSIVFSLQSGEQPIALLCFRSTMLKKHVFYIVPLGDDEKALVLFRFRSKMLLIECVLLCFRSHMCKQPYKMLLIIICC